MNAEEQVKELLDNQVRLLGVLFGLCAGFKERETVNGAEMLEKFAGTALQILGCVHCDKLGKTLAEIVQDGDPKEMEVILGG